MEIIKSILNFSWASNFSDTAVKLLFITFFASILIFVLRQRRSYVYLGARDQSTWRDLRIWAMLILMMQSALYLLF